MIEFLFSFLSFVKKKIKYANYSTRYLLKRETRVNRSSTYFGKIKSSGGFLEKTPESKNKKKGVVLGSQIGKFDLPEDFNDPIEDMKENM